jgi:hypothetical protein
MDNASGCAVLLEAAETLNRLMDAGQLPRPRRSIRFLFGPEGHMSNDYPHSLGERRSNIIGSWTADTVGAKPHIVGGPLLFSRASVSTPTYLNDLGIDLLKESCLYYSSMGDSPVSTGVSQDSVIKARAGSSPFKFETIPYGIHSDNACIAGWGVPAVGIFQWPSIIWHTQYDTVDKLDAGELARCAWATAAISYQVAAAGPREAHLWMHRTANHARRRLTKFSLETQDKLAASEPLDGDSFLEQRLAELEYLVERESALIGSCLQLVRREDATVQASLSGQRDTLVEGLKKAAQYEADTLADFAGMPARGTQP